MPVGVGSVQPVLTYGSGKTVVTVGAASIAIAAANSLRGHLIFVNADASVTLKFNINAAADATSVPLGPGDAYVMQAGTNLTREAVYGYAASNISVVVLEGTETAI